VAALNDEESGTRVTLIEDELTFAVDARNGPLRKKLKLGF
jgi:hypothetical protein